MKKFLLASSLVAGLFVSAHAQQVIYVDSAATGAKNGTSWMAAFTDLSAALTYAQTNSSVKQIWVAKGTYKPDVMLSGGSSSRDNAFVLAPNVSVYGGFAGNEDPADFNLKDRNFQANKTILSGDLDNDGILSDGNAYHVVVIASPGNTDVNVLDGFTITGGNGNSITGGGTLNGQYISSNMSGAVYIANGTDTLRNLVMNDNYAKQGGASAIEDGNVFIDRCTISNNAAQSTGGAIYSLGGTTNIFNSLFYNNSLSPAGYTGAWGGAIDVSESSLSVTNCTFYNNYYIPNAYEQYSGGEAIYLDTTSTPAAVKITNSIFWHNGNDAKVLTGIHNVSYSVGQINADASKHNSNADPLFAGAANGDFQLQSGSPAIDAGINDSLPAGDTLDLAGNSRVVNGTVDMGAYEAGIVNRIRNNGDSTFAGMNGALDITGSSFGNGLPNTYKWRVTAATADGTDTLDINPADYSGYKSILAGYGITFDSTDFIVSDVSKLPTLLGIFTGTDASYWKNFTGDISFSRIVNPGNSATDSVISNVEKIKITTLLPVTVSSFTGSLQNGIAHLQWQTGVESNFNHFEIDKSTDGKSYSFLASVQPKGSNSNYTYSAPQPEPTAYYRLKEIDNDGSETVYPNILTLMQKSKDGVSVYPNPAADHINVKATSAGSISIYDAAGRLAKTTNVIAGVNVIDVRSLSSGIYFGRFNGTGVRFTFIKQ